MANYTAADIKALREKTGAGMLDVKKALDEANGDQQKAAEIIRVKGLKGITKREGRATAEGLVAARVENGVGYMVEVNSETDFVAKSDPFIAFGQNMLDWYRRCRRRACRTPRHRYRRKHGRPRQTRPGEPA